MCAVYIPPSGNAGKAASLIANCIHQQLQSKPDAPIFVLGDFNHCRLESALPGFYQYVKTGTHKDRVLDKCYGTIRDAYAAKIRPPLSTLDHNTVPLIPKFKSALKRSKPEVKTVCMWQDSRNEELSGCFLATDWDVFYDTGSVDTTAEVITDYISFCVQSVIPQKTIKIYSNNKDYMTADIKDCVKRKKAAFVN